ncbi:NUDIX domain-containing protein [Acidomonas methanolica]|uniref:GDP-mannose pyrophosphatase n=1 Tax=Acidomonas methanolica NBRC 104435 TaxID=1231351 RepID=A0A023D6I3_ACIMT|nr:NUDIX hydrolase [Acidomonas methanolica]MBU2655325.1 NUDIX hydrolase [Acidomonas methanolica]TCS24090.1 NUDIX domain-containing protein [Acidomonas methanolica]GAJ29758.1 ADP-ribose pyrophosphatase [Acidomonas methanolica NBRC 104435]GBQ55135.1 ADP-ribose pyrophosphatase [Acidomonas methanolica]GEL00005.1 ADP-ribose pyrophosphatase [Acidomonas methanolica NBRC 104435]
MTDESEPPLPRYEVVSSRMAYSNPWTALREDIIIRPDGKQGLYGVVERGPFVVVMPVGIGREGPTVTLIRQYRYPVNERLWEFPMGMWESRPDAAPEQVAAGELREETGLIAGTLIYGGAMFQGAGYSTQKGHIYLATDLTQGEPAREATEDDMSCLTVPLKTFEAMIARNEIVCMVTLAAFALLRARALV